MTGRGSGSIRKFKKRRTCPIVFLCVIILALSVLMSGCIRFTLGGEPVGKIDEKGGSAASEDSKAGEAANGSDDSASKAASGSDGQSGKAGSASKAETDNGKQRISKKAVYRLNSGTKLTKKKIKNTGGAGRYFQIYRIRKGDRIYKRINGKSYRANPNIGLDDLRYIKTLHYDFDGDIRTGEIIVNKSIAGDVKEIFRALFDEKYQICKMRLIDDYWQESGDPHDADTASMNDDNTSAFNYRTVAGTGTISMHGYGRAVDVNPFENPWCPGGRLYPNQSRSSEFADRNVRKDHMIFSDSKITILFKEHGFRWLGEQQTRDYQHFEK